MWDGREPNLRSQASNATLVHTQPKHPPTDSELRQIVDLETSLFTAQSEDDQAGRLFSRGARGGPIFLAFQPFRPGINSGAKFDPNAFDLYSRWASAGGPDAAARQSVARGQVLFNTRAMLISGVAGFNDVLGQTQVMGTCTTCHNTPNAGNHSVPLPLNIGLADASRRTPDMPLYSLRNTTTGAVVQTTDPGRALITGKWKDIGRFKGPTLRALAPRAPYFHNGFAKDLDEVVKFYNDRFSIGFTDQEREDLVAFLKAL